MKKILSLVMVLAMVLAIGAGCGGDDTPQGGTQTDGKVVKVGIFEPASGENGAGGKQEVLGIRYAHSLQPTVTIGGEEYTVELVEVDNQSDTTKAVTAAQSLASSGVSVVLGSYGSGVSIAAGDTFKTAQIPAIGVSCTNPQVTQDNEYYFRVCFLDPFQGTVMANFAKDEMKADTAFVITQLGDDYSSGLGAYFKQAFTDLGGTVLEAQFQTGETDFNAILTNVLNSDADVIFAPSSIQTAPLLIQQARQMGITMPILAGDTWENESIINNAGQYATDVYLSTFFDENDTSNPAAAEFVTGFKAWLNADAQNLTNNGDSDGVAAVSALGFDAYNVAVAALEAAGSTAGTDVQAALPGVTYENGVTGSISFNENGDANKDMAYIKTINVETGAFDFLKTQSIAE
ncbi:MAG TPA: ABC transporter substrate-binding protein [Candidatus Avidehalobacter gallistercoris]|uniref:ABC transporter substrate-binding protein n=1 Tax=Candidatus Avidehalobacter gallistercoris TaxID=2840694 RepID=A0A9D1HJU4_9FIRM|nr:ABC transporter substrate-binding protein [Candidatus Avidehalobacter gallistercoris]